MPAVGQYRVTDAQEHPTAVRIERRTDAYDIDITYTVEQTRHARLARGGHRPFDDPAFTGRSRGQDFHAMRFDAPAGEEQWSPAQALHRTDGLNGLQPAFLRIPA